MSNRFFITLLVVIAGVVGIFAFTKQKNTDSNTGNSGNSQPTSHIQVQGKSGVVLIEYGDFQCPACGQYYPLVKELVEKYKDQITFQFRNFPLIQIHPNAMVAHRAAEAADKQGKFWEMFDKIYQTQDQWSSGSNAGTIFESFAAELGLDTAKFKADVNSPEVNSSINADIKEGQKLGVTSTPSFILDGVKIDNPRSLEDFTKLIDEAIAKKTKA
ncbi:MAG: thioredoxin domain-containing protein [Negativicutes bacterium]|jgi:protein-disulfide isomerase